MKRDLLVLSDRLGRTQYYEWRTMFRGRTYNGWLRISEAKATGNSWRVTLTEDRHGTTVLDRSGN